MRVSTTTNAELKWPLLKRLPPTLDPNHESGLILDRFLDYVTDRGLELYPAQEEAILELLNEKNVILNTPTGSGKSLVALAMHFDSVARGRKSYYASPIKALVNEKFLSLCADFGPNQVGMITGDATVNPDAPVICCTAEILSNLALREGAAANVGDVILDEFHYYSDRERGVAWQIPLLALPQARFLLMSATLGDTEFFEKELTRLTGRETRLIQSVDRPVPLTFEYSEIPLHEKVMELIGRGMAPIYLVNFTQRECAETAQDFLSLDFTSKEGKKAIADAVMDEDFSSPYGKDIQRLLKHGIGLHHAGLLPKYRILVERLAQKGLLKIICGTDTLGVGVNVPIRTVLFTKLCKFDGQKTSILSVRDFQQISGRAGRKGFDDRGLVVAQAPEHVIENIRQEQKAAGDPKKLKKLVKRKPPEKGFVMWTAETLKKLIEGKPEALTSRFAVNHGMLLNVLSRQGDGCRAMRDLIRHSHESDVSKKRHGKMAFQLFRSLVDRKIIELNPLRVHMDLQQDFSLHQTLGLYLMDTLKLLDPAHPDYALDVLTLVESILENPDLILRKQVDRAKTERLAELKMEGVEYDQRMEELEKVEYPKPNREFIYTTFNEFAAAHPWVGSENIRPKAVAREMYETFASFAEFIRDLELQRVEGLLLRYLSEVYKVLAQTVPDAAKTDEVFAMTDFFRGVVRGVDSSLIDEWEKMRNPEWVKAAVVAAAPVVEAVDVTRDKRGFTVALRNEVFRVVRALSQRDYVGALALLPFGGGDLEQIMAGYYVEHARVMTDPRARSPENTRISVVSAEEWRVSQILVDPDRHNDWSAEFVADIPASRAAGKPVLRWLAVGEIGG